MEPNSSETRNPCSPAQTNLSVWLSILVVVLAFVGSMFSMYPTRLVSPVVPALRREVSAFRPLSSGPISFPDPHNSAIVIGGGLAGLTTATALIDELYGRVGAEMQPLLKDLALSDSKALAAHMSALSASELNIFLKKYPSFSSTLQRTLSMRVVLLDKEANIGGNSAKASSGINAALSERQQAWFAARASQGHPIAPDSITLFARDTQRSCTSPEPPLWQPLDTHPDTHASTTQPDPLAALSPFTPALVDSLTARGPPTVPFLEQPVHLSALPLVQQLDARVLHTVLAGDASAVETAPNAVADKPASPLRPQPNTVKDAARAPPPLFLSTLAQLGGHSRPRTHRPGPGPAQDKPGPLLPVGVAVVSSLRHRLTTAPYAWHVAVYTGARVTGLLCAEDKPGQRADDAASALEEHECPHGVAGVRYTLAPGSPAARALVPDAADSAPTDPFSLASPHLILATGGYSAAPALLQRFAPQLAALRLPTTNGAWATGDHVPMLERLGAALVGMSAVQVHPTGFVDPADVYATTKFLAPEALRGSGGILLNHAGQRFVDELQTRDVVARALYWQPGHGGVLVLSAAAAEAFGLGPLRFYASRGLARRVSAAEVAQQRTAAGLDATAVFDVERLLQLAAERAGKASRVEGLGESGAEEEEKAGGAAPATSVEQLLCTAVADGSVYQWPRIASALGPPADVAAAEPLRSLGLHLACSARAAAPHLPWAPLPALVARVSQTLWEHAARAGAESFAQGGEWWLSGVTPSIHYSMGGAAVDVRARVLRREYVAAGSEAMRQRLEAELGSDPTQLFAGEVVLREAPEGGCLGGVWAVGEAAGGYHGNNRLGGNSLLECVVSGTAAARDVAQLVLGRG